PGRQVYVIQGSIQILCHKFVVVVQTGLEEGVLVTKGIVKGTAVDTGDIQQFLYRAGFETLAPELLHRVGQHIVVIKLNWSCHNKILNLIKKILTTGQACGRSWRDFKGANCITTCHFLHLLIQNNTFSRSQKVSHFMHYEMAGYK